MIIVIDWFLYYVKDSAKELFFKLFNISNTKESPPLQPPSETSESLAKERWRKYREEVSKLPSDSE